MGSCGVDGVHIVSRRMVRPSTLPTAANGGHPPKDEAEVIHLTPWDLRLLTTDYIQKGILLPNPKPPTSGGRLVATLAASLARSLGRFYPFAGRLAAQERGDGTVTISLRCTSDGAELVHATAPGVAVADIADSPAAVISRGDASGELSSPAPVLQRWFLESSPVPIPMPSAKPHRLLRPFERPAVRECFFTFPAASVKKLKATANDEMTTATISSLQALLAHHWRALCRAQRLPPEQGTIYYMIIGCRGRVGGIPPGYVGNALALVRSEVRSTAGEIKRNGLGWTAWQLVRKCIYLSIGLEPVFIGMGLAQLAIHMELYKYLAKAQKRLNRAVASFNEAHVRDWLGRWVLEPEFAHMGSAMSDGAAVTTGSSPRFDVFGNDFGWGKPVTVRSGAAEKMDGATTVFEGREKGGSISLGVCARAGVLARLVDDKEFRDVVNLPARV